MFASDGKPHQHPERDSTDRCECMDLLPLIEARTKAGLPISKKDYEPAKTPIAHIPTGFEAVPLPLLSVIYFEDYAWGAWMELRQGISGNGFGIGQITWSDLSAYQQFTGLKLPEILIRLLFIFDYEYRRHYKEPKAN